MSSRDQILAQIIGGALDTIADEMSAAVTRTARSPVFNEAHDFTTGVFELHRDKLRLVAQSPGCTLHLYAVAMAVQEAVAAFRHDLQPGDIILASDPYAGGTHIPDVVIVAPVFHDRKPILFPAVRAHMGDVGGPVAGGYNPEARDIWQEGLVMPPLKIVSRGERRRDAFDFIVANNRLAHWVTGDLESMIGACQLATRRIDGLLSRFGLGAVRGALQHNIDYTEARVRAEIAGWPDGTYVGETWLDHDFAGHRDVRIVCTATVDGSKLKLDFTGTSPQVAGFVNSPLANSLSFVFLAVAGCCDEDIPINEGFMAPLEIVLPEGSLVNPRRPAPVGNCTCISGAEIAEVTLLAIGGAAPERVGVNCHKNPLVFSYGAYDDGRMWVQLNFLGFTGGAGAAYGTDGWGLYAPLMTGVTTPSIEMTEIQYPSRILKHEYVADRTGVGRWRGTPGVETILQHLSPTRNTVMMAGVRHCSRGYAGGGDGGANRVRLDAGDGPAEVAEMAFQAALPPMGLLETIRGGGGGWGDPLGREIAAIEADLLDGLMTHGSAIDDYGVVFSGNRIDVQATQERREKLRQ